MSSILKSMILILIQVIVIIPLLSFAILKIIDAAQVVWKTNDFRKKWLFIYVIFLLVFFGTSFYKWWD